MLKAENLSIYFSQGKNLRQEVVKGISFTVADGEILGIVGESGSGKTMTALAIAGLLKKDAVAGGSIVLDGVDLLKLPEKEMQKFRGAKISMIFQEPMSALNPTMTIGRQVEETLLLHTKDSRSERREKVLRALEDVELEDPRQLYQKYPHELSGGQRQRVMIAAAIVCRPKLLIADEPTTALDVGTQEEILRLLKKMKQKYGMSILFISHNLRVVKELCSRIVVMKDGELIEEGNAECIFECPRTEYTRQLIEAILVRSRKNIYYEAYLTLYGKKGGEEFA